MFNVNISADSRSREKNQIMPQKDGKKLAIRERRGGAFAVMFYKLSGIHFPFDSVRMTCLS